MCDGPLSEHIEVTFSGIADDSCTECDDFNTTSIVLDFTFGGIPFSTEYYCDWEYYWIPSPCYDADENARMHFTLHIDYNLDFMGPNANKWSVTLYGTGLGLFGYQLKMQWRNYYDTKPVCADLDGMVLQPRLTELVRPFCDISASTATLAAV